MHKRCISTTTIHALPGNKEYPWRHSAEMAARESCSQQLMKSDDHPDSSGGEQNRNGSREESDLDNRRECVILLW